MRLVFFGTPDYVLPVLETLNKYYEIVAVVTQSPKPVGKKKILTYSAVDTWAYKKKIPIYFELSALPKADIGILASYGGLLPQDAFKIFPKGILVIHPSLLPQFRWSSPVPATIISGTNPTGITIFKMDEKFDHGPVITSTKEEVLESDTTETLRNRLFEKSADILLEAIKPYIKNKIHLKPQDDSKATFARMIKKEDAFIPQNYLENAMNLNNSSDVWVLDFMRKNPLTPNALTINRFIRAMKPWPIAWTNVTINEKKLRLKLLSSHLDTDSGYLVLDEVQIEGKNPVSYKQFKEAYPTLTF